MVREPDRKRGLLPADGVAIAGRGDSDLVLFLSYFVATIRTIFPDSCTDTLALRRSPNPIAQAPLLVALGNGLHRLPGRAVLVPDDYYTIRGQAIHDFLSELLRHWPQRLHQVLISRSNPPWPLNRYLHLFFTFWGVAEQRILRDTGSMNAMLPVSRSGFDRPAKYRIEVQGRVPAAWSDRLEGMAIAEGAVQAEPFITTLVGELADQAALAGVLNPLVELHLGPAPPSCPGVRSSRSGSTPA